MKTFLRVLWYAFIVSNVCISLSCIDYLITRNIDIERIDWLFYWLDFLLLAYMHLMAIHFYFPLIIYIVLLTMAIYYYAMYGRYTSIIKRIFVMLTSITSLLSIIFYMWLMKAILAGL